MTNEQKYEKILKKYLDWLADAEEEENENGDDSASDAFASASSMLGILLIGHGLYERVSGQKIEVEGIKNESFKEMWKRKTGEEPKEKNPPNAPFGRI